MKRLVRTLFTVSDSLAWPVVFINLAIAALLPFVAPIHAQMQRGEISVLRIMWIEVVTLALAGAAFAITRRKASALIVHLVPAGILVGKGALVLGAVWLFFVLVVFALPFGLAYLELHKLVY